MANVFERQVRIEAPPSRVWDVLADVERWPAWTASMKKLERLGEGALGEGSRAKLWLRGAGAATVWTISSFEPGRSFSWTARAMPGVTATADHELAAAGDGTDVTLRVRYSGPLGWFMSRAFGRVSRENLETEAEGLKRESERSPADANPSQL